MLSYAKGPEAPLLDLTLGQALASAAERFPDRDALVVRHQGIRWSWRQFDAEVTRVARGLAGLGLEPQDRVGIWAGNCAEWVLLQFACARAGYILVNVNPAYRSHELEFVLGKSRMKALFLFPQDARADYESILAAARRPGQALEHVVRLGTGDWLEMLSNGRDLPATPVLPDDPTNIQYTSGTTGSPKGVLLTHRNLLNNGLHTGQRLEFTERDRLVVPVPMYHCAGCVCAVLNCVTHGAAIVMTSFGFDAGAVLEAIEAERCTAIIGVPTMFIAILNHERRAVTDVSSLRAGYMGGAPCPVELLRRLNSELHCELVCVIYGQTEASPVITMNPVDDSLEQRTSTVGAAMPCTEVKIVDPLTGDTVPVGQPGELCARGYLLMLGYDQEPEATARAIDADGWLHTGDLAIMREDLHFHIRGRSRDMIIRGGENIYPAEVEGFFFTHPKVAEVQVFGLPDARLGETVGMWVRARPGESLTAEELRAWADGKVAHFKVPSHIRLVDSMPMTVTGKVQKFKIRESEIEALGLAGQKVETA